MLYNFTMEVIQMKKIAFLCDSSVALDPKKAMEEHIYIAPLSIIYDGKEFQDQITISGDDLTELLRENKVVKTSQPNIGIMIEMLEELKNKNYDHIFILSVTSSLSGTWNAFQHALDEVKISNVSLIDTMTLAGPVQEAIKLVKLMNEKNKEPKEIEFFLNNEYFMHTESYLYPDNLDQLKAGGRISAPAAALASMLKVKILLKLANHGKNIDRDATSRTEKKIFTKLVEDLRAINFNGNDHILYFPNLLAEDKVERLVLELEKIFGKFDFIMIPLPAALGTHAGIGTLAIQWCLKAENINF